MWRQDSISAPLTPVKVIDQLVNSLTDPASGFILFDDMRTAATPYVVLRGNRGPAKDMQLHVQVAVSGANTRVSATIYEIWSPATHSGTNSVSLGYRDLLTTNNALLNVAGVPDQSGLAFWFKQATAFDPFLVSVLEPHRDGSGNLLNAGDDGSGWPQWGGMAGESDRGSMRTRMNRNYNSTLMPSSVSAAHPSIAWSKEIGGLWFNVPRTPIGNQIYQLHCVGQDGGSWNSSEDNRDWAYQGFPKRRAAAWAGSGALAEGFPPLLWNAQLSTDGFHEVDWRGHLGVAGSILMSQEFGGAPEDSFDYEGSTYRIVFSTRGYAGNGASPVSLAMKVE